ncbi:hypothetical protein BaRGS_00009662 [Batillaria attramentaria]|uniref:Uncharacterized protein n=1 Tax=Batillaria attramentaria TaxID=370345 RepID=A0ABD0LI07_9CAEN
MAHMTMTDAQLQGKGKEQTLRIKRKVEDLGNDVTSFVEQETKRYRQQIQDANPDQVDAFVDDIYDRVTKRVTKKIDAMKQETKSHAPKKPERKREESDESFQKRQADYERLLHQYKLYVSAVGGIMESLVEIFSTILRRVKQFFMDLWNWIKQAISDIAEKVTSFLKMLKNEISQAFSRLFGN